ncbi:MAG: signal recognition particle-docking protein FtsY [Hyphomicrobiales bacterium]|nr:signal recognition particle-docking protein FtsY [Hyphomicrobiales bacterium]
MAKDTPQDQAPPQARASWWGRLKEGLRRSSSGLSTGISDLFTKRRLDAATLDDFEDLLLRADLGVDTATRITREIASGRYGRDLDVDAVKGILVDEIEAQLAPVTRPLEIASERKPFVILMVGVNGSGKTTTIGKLGAKLKAQGRKVMFAAGDTFRAAAIEQLKLWGERVGAPVIARQQGADAASLAFEALSTARNQTTDVLLIDTAGRLQNRTELMGELEKMLRSIKKIDPSAPHAVLLVLDATVGQNALSQVEIFARTAGVTGLVMTKLDGTARGGILVAIAGKFKLPIHLIGVGEAVDDLEPFSARDFAKALVGVE